MTIATVVLGLTGCSSDQDERSTSSDGPGHSESQSYSISGFPLDRSLSGLVSWPDLELVVSVRDFRPLDGVWTTPDGEAPEYLKEGRPPTEAEGEVPPMLVTPVTATVVEAFQGAAKPGEDIIFYLVGGESQGVEVSAANEIAVGFDTLLESEQMIVAGRMRKVQDVIGIDPSFVYSVTGETARSELESASDDPHPEFSIGELRKALAGE